MKAALPMSDPPGMPPSYWAATAAPCPPVPEFDGSEKAETVVIGAGYTGLSAALHLAEQVPLGAGARRKRAGLGRVGP